MPRKMTPKKRHIKEMLQRYANKAGIETAEFEALGMDRYRMLQEAEREVCENTISFVDRPIQGAVHLFVDYSTATTKAFEETLKMLRKMAAVETKVGVSSDKVISYTLTRN